MTVIDFKMSYIEFYTGSIDQYGLKACQVRRCLVRADASESSLILLCAYIYRGQVSSYCYPMNKLMPVLHEDRTCVT